MLTTWKNGKYQPLVKYVTLKDLKKLSNAIDIINGDSDTKGSIKKAIKDLVGEAPEAYDTLKEIADKLKSDDDLHKALNDAIILKASSDALNTEINRATSAETVNKNAIDGEVTRAKSAEKSLQDQITSNDSDITNLTAKHESLSRKVQGIAATGGASTATNVTYNNDNSGLNAENAQDAIDEISSIGHFAKRGGVVNISTNYNSEHIAEVLTLAQAFSKVPSTDRVLGFQGKYLATDGWHTIIYTGNSLTYWGDKTKWIDLADKIFNSISNNATFAGIATPTTNPGTPDGPVFYLASEPGTYANFGGIKVEADICVLTYYNNTWSKKFLGYYKYLTEYNVSLWHPTSGIDGTNKYTLNTAIQKIPFDIRKIGVKCLFVGIDSKVNIFQYDGGEYVNSSSWHDVSYSYIDSKKMDGDYRSNIYSTSALTSKTKNITGIIQLFVSNSDILETKDLSLASIISKETSHVISFYLSDKGTKQNASLELSFNIPINSGVKKYKAYSQKNKLAIELLVDSDNLPNSNYTEMWSCNGYQLNECCFEKYGGKSLVGTFPFIEHGGYPLNISEVVKELYISKGSPESVRLSPININKITKAVEISLYNDSLTKNLAKISSVTSFLGVQVLSFSNDYGYIVIDFDKIESSITSGNIGAYTLQESCFNIEFCPIIRNYLNKIKKDEPKNNLVYDPTFLNIERVYRYVTAEPREQKTICYYNADIKCNVIRQKRVDTGYVTEVTVNLNYIKEIIRQSFGKYIHFGCIARKKDPSTGTIGKYHVTIDGISSKGYLKDFDKTNDNWQFVHGYSLIDKCGDSLKIRARFECDGVTDYSEENTYWIEATKFFVAIYDKKEDIPLDITENDYIINYEFSSSPIKTTDLESVLYRLIERNNFFQIDEATISALYNRFIGIIPNWNLPHTTDFGFISTDIDNYETLGDNADDISYIRAKSPNFYFNGKRRGCMVLFDENDAPFIFDNNGNKRMITIN